MNDRDILQMYREGRRDEAFSLLVAAYRERLYWHIRRFVLSHEETDDLLQEVFIKVWSALPSFRGEAGLFTWIWRIATNESLNHVRRAKIRSALSMQNYEESMAERIGADPSFNGDALQRELHKAIQKLPPKQKTVFNMRYFDELKYEEISDILGISVGSLKASYHHAYTKIKAELEKKF